MVDVHVRVALAARAHHLQEVAQRLAFALRGRAPTAGGSRRRCRARRTGTPAPTRGRRPSTAGRPRSRRTGRPCRARAAPSAAARRRPRRAACRRHAAPIAGGPVRSATRRCARTVRRPAPSWRARPLMVVMPASISRARWVARMPATSSRSSCSRTWIVHSGTAEACPDVSSSQRHRRAAGEVVVEQPLQGGAAGTGTPAAVRRRGSSAVAPSPSTSSTSGATGTPARGQRVGVGGELQQCLDLDRPRELGVPQAVARRRRAPGSRRTRRTGRRTSPPGRSPAPGVRLPAWWPRPPPSGPRRCRRAGR